jgi:tRNA(Ile)-lysidine synthase
LAQSVSEDADFLDSETERAWGELVREARDAVILDRQALSSRPRALQTRLLRRAYFQLAGSLRRLQSSHVEAMLGLLESAPGREVALPMELRLTSTYDSMTMGRAVVDDTSPKPLEGVHRLDVPVTAAEVAVTHIPGWCVTVGWVDVQDGIPTEALEAVLDLGEDVPELWVRGRRRGDRFHPYGMSNEKKLQDFLVNRKVPSAERDAVPLVFHGERLAWVVGHRVAQWAAVSHASRRVLRIRFEASNPSSA